MERLADPRIFGPGSWFDIHVYAAEATTPERKRAFMDFMRLLAPKLKCKTCKDHAIVYLRDHPMENYLTEEHGLFKWSWIFHNTVNRRLGKPEVDWTSALKLFVESDSGVCVQDCGDDGKEIKRQVSGPSPHIPSRDSPTPLGVSAVLPTRLQVPPSYEIPPSSPVKYIPTSIQQQNSGMHYRIGPRN